MRVGPHRRTLFVRAVYAAAEALAKRLPYMYYLGDVFDQESRTMYLDPVHLTPEGNQRIAREITEIAFTGVEAPCAIRGSG